MSSAGCSQKKRKAVVLKGSAETQDFMSWQDMKEDDDKSWEEIGFVRSAVSDSAWWRERLNVKNMCYQKCNEEGFKFFYDLASNLVEDDGKLQ